jgi:hypothetical protein
LVFLIGSEEPGHTRFICEPPFPVVPTGRWNRYTGAAGLVTSTIDVPFGSFLPVRGLNDGNGVPVTGFVPNA